MKRKWMSRFLLVAAVTVFPGCVTPPPSPEVMKAETANYQLPKLPEANKAIAYLVRPAGDATRFNVFLDDQQPQSEMGYTRTGQYIYFNLTPGEHKIFSKAETWADINVSAKAGDIIFIQQVPELGRFFARNDLFKLEDYQGKYYVKTLRVGTIIKTDK